MVFFNVATSGDISFSIEQNTQADFNGTGLDVDFICYGPFTTTDDYCTMFCSRYSCSSLAVILLSLLLSVSPSIPP